MSSSKECTSLLVPWLVHRTKKSQGIIIVWLSHPDCTLNCCAAVDRMRYLRFWRDHFFLRLIFNHVFRCCENNEKDVLPPKNMTQERLKWTEGSALMYTEENLCFNVSSSPTIAQQKHSYLLPPLTFMLNRLLFLSGFSIPLVPDVAHIYIDTAKQLPWQRISCLKSSPCDGMTCA